MHERESETSVATGVVLADGDDPVCVYCSAAGTCSSIAGKSLSSPLHVTVRPAGGRGRDGEEKMHGERENGQEARETKGQKAIGRGRPVVASCMDFELAACMLLPIPCWSAGSSKPL
jgi:hypothetical protein